MTDPISAAYEPWSASAYPFEVWIGVAPNDAFARILTRIERAPHQVAVRRFGAKPDIWAKLPDYPDPVPFATVVTGLTPEDAEAARQFLKARGWRPGERVAAA